MGKVQELYHTIFNQVNVPILLIQQGCIQDANRQAQQLLGYEVEALLEQPITAVSAETQPDGNGAEAAWTAMETAVFTNGDLSSHRWRYRHAEGHAVLVEQDLTSVNTEDDPILCVTLRPAPADQERLATIVQDTGSFVGIASPDGRVLYVNPAGREKLEMDVKGGEPPHIGNYLSEESAVTFQEVILPTALADGSWEGEVTFRTQNGRRFPVLATITVHHDQEGNVDYLTTIARDISALKEAEQILREREDQFRQVISSAPLVVFTTDEEGIFTMSEGRSLAKLGLEPGQVVGLSAFEMYKDFPDIVSGLEKALQGEMSFTPSLEVAGLYFDSTFAPLRNAEGEVVGVSGVSVDVTEVTQVQRELEQQRDFLQHVLDINPNFVFVKDRSGRFVLANKALAEAYGVTVDELVGMRDADFAQDPEEAEHFRRDDLAVLDSGEEKIIPEEPITDVNGNIRWLQTTKRPISGPAGEEMMLLGVAVDITERKLAEEQSQLQLQISNALALAETEEDLIRVMVDVADLINAATAVFIREEEDGRNDLVLRAQNIPHDKYQPIPEDTRIGSHELPRVFSADEVFVSSNAQNDESISKAARRLARRIGAVSWVSLPLSAGAEWYGNILLATTEEGSFNERLVNMYLTITEQAALAIRAARLFRGTQRSLERRTREVALSTQIAQDIASATDLSDLYQRVVTQVQEQFGYYYTQLLRYDPALDTVALAFGYGEIGEKMRELNHSVPMGVGIIGEAAATGQSVLRPHVVEDGDWQPNSLLPRTKGELAVPIKLGDQVMGVLDVQSDQIDALDANDQLLLEGLCGQIAVAIESTRLQQEMETNLRELTALQRYMIREGWDDYREKERQTPGYQFDQGGIHVLPSAKAPVETNGYSQERANGQRDAMLDTPLQIRGEAIGSIGIISDDEKPLKPEEEDFLQSVAEQVSEALEVARLFEQTQRALSEQERLTGELETVAQLSTVASTILEVEALLQQVADLAKRSFDLYHAHIYLLNAEEEKLVLQAGAGNVGRLMVLEGHEISLNADAIVARAARTQEPVIENDVRKSLDFLPNPFLPNTQSEMAIPLIVGENVIGVLDLQGEEQDRFSEDDIRIQTTLASQIAVAIENARLYAEQVETTAKLREVDQLKSEFLASMSHELRTPLNSIIGFADVLLEGLDGELNERMEEDVRLIRESGKHLRALIGDILDMSKIEAGRMELRYEEVDMQQMAKDIIATAQPLVNEKGLDLYVDVDEDVGIFEIDRTRIRQVLWNIMGNAVKFTEEGSVTLTMELEDPNHLMVSIRDTGIGIAPENLDIVFEQFRQVDGKLNRRAGGTGLGMPISKRLVELHGGEIGVESTMGEGSTFWFILPRTRRHASRPKTGPLSPPSA